MSLAHDYRSQLNAQQADRRSRLWSASPVLRLVHAKPLSAFVGDQHEHVIAWRIEHAVRKAALVIAAVKRVSWKAIVREVIDGTDVSMTDILSARRGRGIAWARQAIMYRLATETAMSYPQIGRALGDRDHTTILHGVRAHAARNGLPNPSPCTGKKAARYAS